MTRQLTQPNRREFGLVSFAALVLPAIGSNHQEPTENNNQQQDPISQSVINSVSPSCIKLQKGDRNGSGVII